VETYRALLAVAYGVVLQWGHAFVSVETAEVREQYVSGGALQWGHAFVSVETAQRPRRSSRWY